MKKFILETKKMNRDMPHNTKDTSIQHSSSIQSIHSHQNHQMNYDLTHIHKWDNHTFYLFKVAVGKILLPKYAGSYQCLIQLASLDKFLQDM